MVHAVLVQSTVAAGQIAGFDLSAAQGMPGVLAIITPDNAIKLTTDGKATQAITAPTLQNMDVLYNGQHGRHRGGGHAGAGAGRGPPRCGCTTTRARRRPPWPARWTRPTCPRPSATANASPTAAAATRPSGVRHSAALKFEATYTTPVEHHNPMEPHATIAAWDGGKLTVWTATQGISGAQSTLARAVRAGQGGRAGDLPVRRRRLRLQGQHPGRRRTLAAMAAMVVGPPGEARAVPRADVHLQRLPPDDGAEAGDRRRPGRHAAIHPA